MKISLKILFFCLLVGSGAVASAHQPIFVGQTGNVQVTEPEISKAYYGFLPGKPATFVIRATSSFPLYLGLLVPIKPESPKNISALLVNEKGEVVGRLAGDNFDWQKWHEEYAGDDYWRGPELKKDFPAGTYTVVVNTPENWERYVLAIGEQEDFSLAAFPGLLHELYFVKTEFFQKTAWSIFEGKIGRGLLIVTLILIVSVILFVFWFFKKTKRI